MCSARPCNASQKTFELLRVLQLGRTDVVSHGSPLSIGNSSMRPRIIAMATMGVVKLTPQGAAMAALVPDQTASQARRLRGHRDRSGALGQAGISRSALIWGAAKALASEASGHPLAVLRAPSARHKSTTSSGGASITGPTSATWTAHAAAAGRRLPMRGHETPKPTRELSSWLVNGVRLHKLAQPLPGAITAFQHTRRDARTIRGCTLLRACGCVHDPI